MSILCRKFRLLTCLVLQALILLFSNPYTIGQPVGSEGRNAPVSLVFQDTLVLTSEKDFDLPFIIRPACEVAAINLGFYFPTQYLSITGLELSHGAIGYSWNVDDSLCLLAWSSISPLLLDENDTLLVLNMKTLDLSDLEGTIRLELYELSELADPAATVISDVELEIPELMLFRPDTIDSVTGYYVHVYPNPFDDIATIYFGLSQESRVRISIVSSDGKVVMDLGEKVYPAGDQEIKLHGAELGKGVHLLKFSMSNSTGNKEELFKILSLR